MHDSPPPAPLKSQITVEEYLRDRLEHQLEWYDRKSVQAQRRYKRLRRAEIVLAASLPLLTIMDRITLPGSLLQGVQPWVLALVGVAVAIIAGLLSMNHYQEHWIKYRTTAESLKHEKFRFQMRADPYDGTDALGLLVSRVESLISQENSAWAQLASSSGDKQHANGARPAGDDAEEAPAAQDRIAAPTRIAAPPRAPGGPVPRESPAPDAAAPAEAPAGA